MPAASEGHRIATPGLGRMTPAEAFAVLDLPLNAGEAEVHTAYRRLAFEHHPDRNRGHRETIAQFKQVTRAYRLLKAWYRLEGRDANAGMCHRCGKLTPLRMGLDRLGYCRRCLMYAAGPPALPAPGVVVVTCAFTIVMLGLAIVLLVLGAGTRQFWFTAGALASGAIGVTALAVTAVMIGEVHRARRRGSS